MESKKKYTPEEIELNKFYSCGMMIYKLIKRTGKQIEDGPGEYSNFYVFELTDISVDSFIQFTKQEIPYNPNCKMFSEVDFLKIKKIIKSKEREVEVLNKILKQQTC